MDNNLVKLTDEQLDEITGAGNPDWLSKLSRFLGPIVIKWWDEGGAAGVKQNCYQFLGSDNSICNSVPNDTGSQGGIRKSGGY